MISASSIQPDGVNREGLTWGYRFSASGVVELIHGVALRDALDRQESWLWLNFDLSDPRSKAAIEALPNLPPAAVAMLLSTDDRQHIDRFGPVIAGVVADLERDSMDVRRVVRWQFVMAPHLFVSARRMPGHTLHQLHQDLQSGRSFPDVLLPTRWNKSQLLAPMINPRDGSELKYEVSASGETDVPGAGGRNRRAERYLLSAGQPLELWCDRDQVWVGLRARVFDGSRIEYLARG